MALTVTEQSIITAGLNAAGYTVGADMVISKNKAMAASGDAVVTSSTKVTRALLDGSSAYDKYMRSLDGSYAAAAKYTKAQDDMARAVRNGWVTQNAANGILAAAATKYGQVTESTLRAEAATRQATTSQAAYNASVGGVQMARYGAELQKRADDIAAYGVALDKVKASYNPLFAAQQSYQAQLLKISDAERQGAIGTAEATVARARATTGLNAAIAANKAYADSLEEASRKKTLTPSGYDAGFSSPGNHLAAVNANFGVKNPLYGDDLKAREADVAAYGAELDRLRAKYNPIFAVSKQYENEVNEIAKAQKMGAISAQEAEAATERAGRAMANADGPTRKIGESLHVGGFYTAGLTREMIVLGHEVVVGNFSRIPGSLLVLAERFGKLEVLAGAAMAAIISPMGLMAAGILAVGAALAILSYQAEASERRLMTLRNSLLGVHSDFATLAPQVTAEARQLSSTTSLDRPEATGLLTEVHNSPLFQGSSGQAIDIAKTFSSLNLVLKETAGDTKTLAEALKDPAKVMQDLVDRHIRGFNQGLVNTALQMEAAGRTDRALSLLLDHLATTTKDVGDDLTPLQTSMRHLDEAFMNATGSADGLAITIGKGLNEALAASIEGWSRFIYWTFGHKEGGPAGSSTTGPPGVANNNDAVGMFQLRRPAAEDVGMTPDQRFDYSQNITGGLKYFRQQLEGSGGNLDDATRAYNQGPKGAQEGKGYDYLRSVQGQNAAALPPQALDDITRTFGTIFSDFARTAAGPEIRNRVLQIAMQESGGKHYTTAGAASTSMEPTFATTSAADGHGLGPAVDQTANTMDKLYQSAVQFQRTDIQAQIDQFTTYRDKVGASSEAGQHAAAVIQDLRVKLEGLRDPLTEQEKMAQTARDAAVAFGAEVGAARELLAIRDRFAQISRDTHTPIDQSALSGALGAKQQELTAQFNDENAKIGRTTAVNSANLAVIEQGGQAAEFAANAHKALEEAIKTSTRGSEEFTRQVQARTAALNADTASVHERTAAADISHMDDEADTLKLELSLINATVAARARELAILQARQKYGLSPGQTADPEQQKAINEAGNNAVYKTAVEQAKQGMQELESLSSSVLDKMTAAFTEPLKQGETAATRFRDTVKSVLDDITKEFVKLAIINPMMNALFPSSNRPTLGSMGDAAGKLLGGSGASGSGSGGGGSGSGGGGSSGGLGSMLGHAGGAIGWGVDQIGGQGFYKGGGLIGSLFGGPASSAYNALPDGMAGPVLDSGGGIGSFLSGLFHQGGMVGSAASTRAVPSWVFDSAPRFHSGLNSDEFAAILQKGERVLTANQNGKVEGALSAASRGGSSSGGVTFNIATPNADSFRASQPQLQARASASLSRTRQRG